MAEYWRLPVGRMSNSSSTTASGSPLSSLSGASSDWSDSWVTADDDKIGAKLWDQALQMPDEKALHELLCSLPDKNLNRLFKFPGAEEKEEFLLLWNNIKNFVTRKELEAEEMKKVDDPYPLQGGPPINNALWRGPFICSVMGKCFNPLR